MPVTLQEYQDYIRDYRVPPETPCLPDDPHNLRPSGVKELEIRGELNARGCWIFIALDWTKKLAEWIGERKVLEIMAGGGWLAYALNKHGVNIVATDDNSWEGRKKGTHRAVRLIHPVLPHEAVYAVKVVNDAEVLLVSWPPYTERRINVALDHWGTKRPIIYIGEGEEGCTANDTFFKYFREDEDAPQIYMPSFFGLHDRIFIGNWTRKNKRKK